MKKNFFKKFFTEVKNLLMSDHVAHIGTTATPLYRAEDFLAFYLTRESVLCKTPCERHIEDVHILYIGTEKKNFGDCFAIKQSEGYVFCPIGGTTVMYATRHDLIVRPITEFSTTLLDGHILVEGVVKRQELVVEKTSILSEGKVVELPCTLAQLVQKLS
jgi:hypothetical protein